MPGLVPGIHVFAPLRRGKTWMAGTSPAMTQVVGSGMLAYERNTAPVFFATSPTIFCATASISTSVSVLSVG